MKNGSRSVAPGISSRFAIHGLRGIATRVLALKCGEPMELNVAPLESMICKRDLLAAIPCT